MEPGPRWVTGHLVDAVVGKAGVDRGVGGLEARLPLERIGSEGDQGGQVAAGRPPLTATKPGSPPYSAM